MNPENRIRFDTKDIETKTAEFETRFKALANLSSGNKVGIDDEGNLYAEFFTNPYVMAVIRKITGQKRENINAFLIQHLGDYEEFLLFVINAYETGDQAQKGNMTSTITTHKMLCLGLVTGLKNLKNSYPDYEPINETCTKYMDKFNLFKGKSNSLTLPFSD